MHDALRKHWLLLLIWAGLAVAGILLFCVNPMGSRVFPPCPTWAVLGVYCPGCGSLRALHQLLHGHLPAALRLNPLMVLSIPFLAWSLLRYTVSELTGRPLRTVFLPKGWILALFGLIVLYGVVRNIPVYPFDLLAPHMPAGPVGQ